MDLNFLVFNFIWGFIAYGVRERWKLVLKRDCMEVATLTNCIITVSLTNCIEIMALEMILIGNILLIFKIHDVVSTILKIRK